MICSDHLYSPLKSENGSAAVLIAFTVPLMVLMIMVVSDIGTIIVNKNRLQNAADFAVLSAATVMSCGFNEIAALSIDLEEEFSRCRQLLNRKWRDRGEAEDALEFYYNGYNGVLDYIKRYQSDASCFFSDHARNKLDEILETNLADIHSWHLDGIRTGAFPRLVDFRGDHRSVYYRYYRSSGSSNRKSSRYSSLKTVYYWPGPSHAEPQRIKAPKPDKRRKRRRFLRRRSPSVPLQRPLRAHTEIGLTLSSPVSLWLGGKVLDLCNTNYTDRNPEWLYRSIRKFNREPMSSQIRRGTTHVEASADAYCAGGNLTLGIPGYHPVLKQSL